MGTAAGTAGAQAVPRRARTASSRAGIGLDVSRRGTTHAQAPDSPRRAPPPPAVTASAVTFRGNTRPRRRRGFGAPAQRPRRCGHGARRQSRPSVPTQRLAGNFRKYRARNEKPPSKRPDTPGNLRQGYCAHARDRLISGRSGVVAQASSHKRGLPWGNAGVNMNKRDLIDALSGRLGDKKSATEALNAVFATIRVAG